MKSKEMCVYRNGDLGAAYHAIKKRLMGVLSRQIYAENYIYTHLQMHRDKYASEDFINNTSKNVSIYMHII